MKIIILKRPDGGCSIVRPAPEMFDPNSRTIRGMEVHGDGLPSIKKIKDIEAAKQAEIKKRFIGALTSLEEEYEKRGLDLLGTKARDITKRAAQASGKYNDEIQAWSAEQAKYDEDRRSHPGFNMEQFLEEAMQFVIERNDLAGKDYRIAEESCLPADREFRNAWTDDNPTETVDVDIPKARNVLREKMRFVRAPLLDALDDEHTAAERKGDAVAKGAINAKKQELLDVTKDPAIDAAKTPEDLKKVWPGCLGPRH